MARNPEPKAIANQITFVSDQMRVIAERLNRLGFDEIAHEMEALANTAEFFRDEFDRARGEALADESR